MGTRLKGAIPSGWSWRLPSRSRAWIVVAGAVLLPAVLWLGHGDLASRFGDPTVALKSLANLSALTGTATFAVSMILGARLNVLLLSPIWALCNGINLLRWPAGALPGASPGEIAAQEMMQ